MLAIGIKTLHVFDPIGRQLDIGIYAADDVASGSIKAGITGKHNALPGFVYDYNKREQLRYFGCPIGRIVVYHNDFVWTDCLRIDGCQTGLKMALFIEGWYNYTNAQACFIHSHLVYIVYAKTGGKLEKIT
jgi:hypothetical protein